MLYQPYPSVQVCANDISSQMSGYLQMMVRRSWRRGWFVLKDRVLYEYRAPQDVCALYSLPVLGYQVEAINKVMLPYLVLQFFCSCGSTTV